MARKHVVYSFKMYDSADITTVTDSNIVNVANLDKASIDITWSGTAPVADIDVQARNGEKEAFRSIDFGGPASISGASGQHDIIFTELPFTDIKLVLTFTSGTGNVDAIITAKTVGA